MYTVRHVGRANAKDVIPSDLFWYRDDAGIIRKGCWQSEEDREIAEYVGVTYATRQDALADCGH